MSVADFIAALEGTALPSVFNPWRDECEIHDLPGAAQLRRDNLHAFLRAAIDADIRTMWIARDLGYRGGRRTGVPLTDEVHLSAASTLLGGIELARATEGPPVAERTAAVIWRVLTRVGEPVVLWNVFPFHPHEDGDPMSNRCHSRSERLDTWPLLEMLIDIVRPSRIVAIGRDADLALTDCGVETAAVRHPSYGGQAEFMAGIYDLYGVAPEAPTPQQLSMFSPDAERSAELVATRQ